MVYLRIVARSAETVVRQFVVEWIAFWAVFMLAALPAALGVAALNLGSGQGFQSSPTIVVLLSLACFVSLLTVEGFRGIVWLRNSGARFWNSYTPPYRSGGNDSDVALDTPLHEVKARTTRQTHLAIFGFVGIFLFTVYVDVSILASGGPKLDDSYLAAGAQLLMELFPPVSIAVAISDVFLPQDQRTATFYVMLFAGGAIPFAFPIRNALTGFKIGLRNEWTENRPTNPPALNQLMFVVILLLISVGLPMWFLWFLSTL